MQYSSQCVTMVLSRFFLLFLLFLPFYACKGTKEFEEFEHEFDSLYKSRNYEQALRIGEEALVSPGIKDSVGASFFNLMGLSALEIQHYPQALGYFERAVKMVTQQSPIDSASYVIGLTHIGKTYYASGQYSQALEVQNEVIRLHKEISSNWQDISLAYYRLTMTYDAMGRLNDAKEAAKQSYILGVENGASFDILSYSAYALINAYVLTGEVNRAEHFAKEIVALSIKENNEGSLPHADALLRLANVYRAQKRYQQMDSLTQKTLSIYNRELGKDDSRTIEMKKSIARLYDAIEKK